MSQDLFEEIRRKLYGNGVTNAAVVTDGGEGSTTNMNTNEINSQEDGAKGFIWKPVPPKNKLDHGNDFTSPAQSSYPMRLGISSSDEESCEIETDETKCQHQEILAPGDDSAYGRNGENDLEWEVGPLCPQQGITMQDKKSMKMKLDSTEREDSEDIADDYNFIEATPISFSLPGISTIHQGKAHIEPDLEWEVGSSCPQQGITMQDKKSMKRKLDTTESEDSEDTIDDYNFMRATPITYSLGGSSTIHQVKADIEPGMENNPVTGFKGKNKDRDSVYKIYHALPVSYCLPGTTTIYPMDSKQGIKRRYKDLMDPLNQTEPKSLTHEERKKGYIEETRIRTNCKSDKFFYHVKSEQRFRSLKGVHKYIKYGDDQGESSEKRYQGKTYLESKTIGKFDFKTKSIMPADNVEGGEQISSAGIEVEAEFNGTNRTTRTLSTGLILNFELLRL